MFQDAGVASHSGHGGLVTGLRSGGVGQVSDAADAVPQGAPRVAARLMAADAVPKCAPHVAASVVACALLAGPQSHMQVGTCRLGETEANGAFSRATVSRRVGHVPLFLGRIAFSYW